MTYTVTAINSSNRVVCAKAAHEREARKTAKVWRKDAGLRSVQIISRDEYGRGRIDGSADSFATWIVGPVAEVTAHLRTRGNGEEERAKYARLAEEIEAANGNTETPAALLAHVLGLSSEKIAGACAVAGIKLERA